MAQQEFTRYVGYDDADEFRGFLIDRYVAVQKNGLFFKEKLPAPSTDEIAKAASYTAASFDSAADIKKSLEMWLHDANIPCDSAALAEIMAKAVAECGVNKKNTYFVMLCWLMKYLGKRPSAVLFVGSATLRELYFLFMLFAAGVRVTLVSYGLDKDFEKLPYQNKIYLKDGKEKSRI